MELPNATRRRNDKLMAAIHEATRAQLAERGYAGVTFEGVARRARTSRSVLYRRAPERLRAIWCSPAPPVTIFSGRSRRPDGSRPP
jgi:hypothetical protein